MAKGSKVLFVCQECGFESPKWLGKCPGCENWNTLVEEVRAKTNAPTNSPSKGTGMIHNINDLFAGDEIRYKTNISEFDRVLGGGIVKGSLVLVGGDPGIGKSTILLQVCKQLDKNIKIMYVTGEESPRQIKLRADRLGVQGSNLSIMAETDVEIIKNYVMNEKPQLVIIDSIQTMFIEAISSSPGSVSQVRESTAAFMRLAKDEGVPIFLVGHVNKEGSIAGPKVMEHMVDTVLYFEGEKQLSYRILRAVKNRFGSTNEIGVFEMTDMGLKEVLNPSLMFLSGRPKNVSGTSVVCILEGSRPLLAEVQTLVSQTPFSAPRRMAVGLDYNRVCLLLAVLEKRCGLLFSSFDVYVNVVGGIKLDEPSSDLGVIISLASSIKDFIIPEDTIIIGEVGLAGEVRAVSAIDGRILEASRLGFKKCIIPYQNKPSAVPTDMEILKARSVREVINILS
jgi:DNA repair protein RadA/Sms